MSQENVEVVRLLYGEWFQGDFSNRKPFHEDLDFEMSGWTLLQSDPIKARGLDGMASVWREVLRGWDDFRAGPIEELMEAGDQIVVLSRLVGRGRRSGVQVDAPRGAVFTFREGKITRLFLAGREEALEAVGLSELAMSQENVDIVKRAHAALSRGDTEAFIREMDERIEGMSRVMDAEGITYSGHDGIRRFVADLLSVFPDFRSEVVNAVEDNATVVAELRFGGSATRSALAVEGRTWQALTFRGGKILSFRAYETEAEALEAVGLRE